MAGTPAGRGARHAPLGPRRPLARPQPPAPRSGRPPAQGCARRRGPGSPPRGRRSGGVRDMLAEGRGGRGCSRDRCGRPLSVPRAPLGTGDSASPPSSRGLQQLPPGPSLVRWARERRRARWRSSPVPTPGRRAPRPPLARARAPSRRYRGREPGSPRSERARTRESVAGATWGPTLAGRDRRGTLPGGRGQARCPGTPGAQVPFGGKHRHAARLRLVATGVWGREGVCGPQTECLLGKPN